MSRRFIGKVALVTGGTSGIGAAAVHAFAREGAAVVIVGRRTDRGLALQEEVRAKGGTALYVNADVANECEVEGMMRTALGAFGQVDCAFNNAGVSGRTAGTCAEVPLDTWETVMSVNLRGVWLCMKHELRFMQQRGRGAIVNTASIYAHAGADFGIAPYVASKHGVLGLTRAAAVELRDSGIRVNALCPGMTRTEMTTPTLEAFPDEFNENVRRSVPMGRLAEADEVADAVLWMCCEGSRFMTGQSVVVDGGFLAR